MFMHILCIYKKNIILISLFKIDTLNFIMNILTIMTCSFIKNHVIGLHNLISMNIFSPWRIMVFLYNCKETAENKWITEVKE